MPESYPFPVYSGILEPKHYKQIGSAIWLFLWCISSTTGEEERDGVTWGIVLGNKPVKIDEIAGHFGVERRTVERWIKTLEQHGYIQLERASHGLIFSVRKSKKYKNRYDKNVASQESDTTKMSYQDDVIRQKCRITYDKNVVSQQDIIQDIKNNADDDSISDDEVSKRAQEVENYFVVKRGSGSAVSPDDYKLILQMIKDRIPVDLIKTCIDKAFADYKPKHRLDKIRTISYCAPIIYEEWSKRTSLTENVPSEPVALGRKPKNKPAPTGPHVPGVEETRKYLEELEQLRLEKQRRLGRAANTS